MIKSETTIFTNSVITIFAKAFSYNYLDIDYKEFGFDQIRINTIRKLQDKCIILKPDKGQGVVLIKKSDYKQFMERLFSDQRKFKVLNEDPTIRI